MRDAGSPLFNLDAETERRLRHQGFFRVLFRLAEEKVQELIANPTPEVITVLEMHAEVFGRYETDTPHRDKEIQDVLGSLSIEEVLKNQLTKNPNSFGYDAKAAANTYIDETASAKNTDRQQILKEEGLAWACDNMAIPADQFQPMLLTIFDEAYHKGLMLSRLGKDDVPWDTIAPTPSLVIGADWIRPDIQKAYSYARRKVQDALKSDEAGKASIFQQLHTFNVRLDEIMQANDKSGEMGGPS